MNRNFVTRFRDESGRWAATSLTVLLGLQMVRMLLFSFVGYLREVVGVDSLTLGPIALGIFALSFLAGAVRKLAGARRAYWLTAGGLGLTRLAEQVSVSPQADFVLSATGVVLFLWFIPIALGHARGLGTEASANFGLAFLLGVATDTALNILGGTLDLSWQPGLLPILIVLAIVFFQLRAVRMSAGEMDPDAASDGAWGRTFALAALGPWLFLQLLVFQNAARLSALTGWATPASGALIVASNALGLAAGARVARSGLRAFGMAIGAGILLVISLLQPEPPGVQAALQLVAGQILSFALAMILFTGLGWEATRNGLTRATVANGVGQILFVLLSFLYYVTYDISLGFRGAVTFPVATGLVAIGAIIASRDQITYGERGANAMPALAALILLLAPLGPALRWNRLQATPPPADNRTVRVMSYNLHNAANTDGRLDIEAIAQVIEASGADVVALQEVSRGWIIWSNLDMLEWLSQRLDMPYVYGPTADAQWGNALLSRYPILSAETFPLSPEVLPRRGFIRAEIDIGGGTLTVIATHFTHRGDHDTEREIMASEILDAWGGADYTLILGDLNATPDKLAMEIFANAGYVDLIVGLGLPNSLTFPSTEPNRQIDYIWITSELAASGIEVIQTRASDHLPIVATITLP